MSDLDGARGLFLTRPVPKGSAQCPKCGRFTRIVRMVSDASPLSAEEGGYAVVDCALHGRGISC
jgi:hypothetical protein